MLVERERARRYRCLDTPPTSFDVVCLRTTQSVDPPSSFLLGSSSNRSMAEQGSTCTGHEARALADRSNEALEYLSERSYWTGG